ncbi:MAG: hypothetical protein Q8S73_23785 [Deltaproteobacteria bacterium]|nr:hypothetical protein [Myxococcales bacterium]MDP3217153.1 hypothetical protein [Deltaproteobacteria bacterium]
MPLEALCPIRCRGPIHIYSASGILPGRRSVVLRAGPHAEPLAAARALDAIERAHDAAAGELIAAPIGRGRHGGREFLALDATSAFDGERVLQSIADGGRRIPYPAAIGMLLRLADALARAHAVKPPVGPLAVGTLLPCQFLFDVDGRATLLGLGDNVIASSAPAGLLVAPEVQLGQRPDRRTDGFALAALMRSLVPYTALPPIMERALRGVRRASERGIHGRVRDFQRRMWSAPPRLRPDAERLAAGFRVFARVLGVEPDAPGFERFIAEVMAPEVAVDAGVPARLLRVSDDGAWFELDDTARCRLASRASLRRLLGALVDQHRERPAAPLELHALLELGWPGERVSPESGAHRVHVAVSELRRMGLRASLERFDLGYRLDPALVVQRVAI